MRSTENITTALLISGGGSTAKSVIEACQSGRLVKIKPVVVIASRASADGISEAERLGIPTKVINPKSYPDRDAFGEALIDCLSQYRVDLVSQNGWLPMTPGAVVKRYPVINQHPGPLDPGGQEDFSGKGMHGIRVHTAVLAYHWQVGTTYPFTEACVYLVTDEEKYDKGNLIRVNPMSIEPRDMVPIWYMHDHPAFLLGQAKLLQNALLPLEHQTVIEALTTIGERGNVPGFLRSTRLIPEDHLIFAQQSKRLAINLHR